MRKSIMRIYHFCRGGGGGGWSVRWVLKGTMLKFFWEVCNWALGYLSPRGH